MKLPNTKFMPNGTGRRFKCIGLTENSVKGWNEWYTIGNVYKELQEWLDGMLCLSSDTEVHYYVDAGQFEEIK